MTGAMLPIVTTLAPVPCVRCGWQYPAETLAAAARGEVRLDPQPTHACVWKDGWVVTVTFESGAIARTTCSSLIDLRRAVYECRDAHMDAGDMVKIEAV